MRSPCYLILSTLSHNQRNVDLPRPPLLPPYLHLSVPTTPLVRLNASRRQPLSARKDEAFPLTKLEFDDGENGGGLRWWIASTSACPVVLLPFSWVLRHPESHRAHQVQSPSYILVPYSRYTPFHIPTSAVKTYPSTLELGMWAQIQGLLDPWPINSPTGKAIPPQSPSLRESCSRSSIVSSTTCKAQHRQEEKSKRGKDRGGEWERASNAVQRTPSSPLEFYRMPTLPFTNPTLDHSQSRSQNHGFPGFSSPFDSSPSRSFPSLHGIASSIPTAIPNRHTHPRPNLVKQLLESFSYYPAPQQHQINTVIQMLRFSLKIAIPPIIYPHPGPASRTLSLTVYENQWIEYREIGGKDQPHTPCRFGWVGDVAVLEAMLAFDARRENTGVPIGGYRILGSSPASGAEILFTTPLASESHCLIPGGFDPWSW
ncbi:hypothetical protein NMY22_g10302 [Coprinellus aureogranulatus]|nr:hypothetical protein NMY22_g10302 [Coprinellus aureogranulatus]